MTDRIRTQSFNVRGADGNDLKVSETVEGHEVVVSIQQNDDHGRLATVRLSRTQFAAFIETRYLVKFAKEEEEE